MPNVFHIFSRYFFLFSFTKWLSSWEAIFSRSILYVVCCFHWSLFKFYIFLDVFISRDPCFQNTFPLNPLKKRNSYDRGQTFCMLNFCWYQLTNNLEQGPRKEFFFCSKSFVYNNDINIFDRETSVYILVVFQKTMTKL